MNTEEFPSVPEDLLNALEKAFPNTLPSDTKITLNEVNVRQGQQQVIAFLRIRYERQNRNILEAP